MPSGPHTRCCRNLSSVVPVKRSTIAPVRVTGFDVPYPYSKLEMHHIPGLDRILDGVDRALGRPNSLSGLEG